MSRDRILVAPARVMLSLIFVVSGTMKLTHWSTTAAYMTSHGLPLAPWLLAAAVVVEVLGGLSVLLGVRPRLGALALLAYLIPVTLVFHAFWRLGGMEAQMQAVNFLKNLSIMGGLLALGATSPARAKGARRADGERTSGRELPATHSPSAA